MVEEKDNVFTQIQSKNDDFQSKAEVSPMEKILNNPGLVHLAENIFGNLADEDAEVCQDINQSSKQILENPMFWLRKFSYTPFVVYRIALGATLLFIAYKIPDFQF